MNNLKHSSQLVCLFFTVLSLLAFNTSAPPISNALKPLGHFLNSNSIKVEVIGLGGHRESCVQLTVKNRTNRTIKTFLEPGRRLVSDDAGEQDIFIVKKTLITIAPLASSKVQGYGFCCQSSLHSPADGSGFSVGFMAPTAWLELADTIDKYEFDASAIQSAVWALSDHHSISSIYSLERSSIYPLLQTVATLRNETLPWYSYTYVEDTTLFSNKIDRIHGKFDYYIKNNAAVSIVVKTAKGKVMTTLKAGGIYGHGKQAYDVNFKVKDWPKGDYDILVIEDFSNINTSIRFNI
ncbi:MAG: hypothetical protein ACI9JN_000613 [Bacteroidia bacterium]|jgi:hypothetical protein